MSGIANYLIGIIGTCIIASLARLMLSGSKHFKSLGNTIVGVFLVFSVLSPIVRIDWNIADLSDLDFTAGFDRISADADFYQQQALKESIIAKTQSYIWNKAEELSLDVELEITLSETYPYVPCAICIRGQASPYAKAQLSSYLANEIGIPKEAQTWMSARS